MTDMSIRDEHPEASPLGVWNVPNALSFGRLALTFAVCGLIAGERWLGASAVFAVAAITDAFDGYLARLLKQETAFGRQLDPLIDKLMVLCILVYLIPVSGSGVERWMVAAIATRELLIQALRGHLEGGGRAFGARWSGKLKTTVQCLAIVASLACLAWSVEPTSIGARVRDVLLWGAVALTIYSGVAYVWSARPRWGRS